MQKLSEFVDRARMLMSRKFVRLLAVLVGMVVMSKVFSANAFRIATPWLFNTFQIDSEALVVSNIVADRLALEKGGARLGYIALDGEFRFPATLVRIYQIFREGPGAEELSFSPYTSSFGGQGWFFSAIARGFEVRHIVILYRINAVLLTIVLMGLFLIYRKIYDRTFAWVFLLVMIGSPWVVSFARNLYWVPFLWFLPSVFSGLLLLATKGWQRLLFAAGIVFAVFAKSATGYEYLSSITLLAASPFLVSPLLKGRLPSRSDWFWASTVFALCIVGFALALGCHASMRGDGIVEGLMNIYERDVKRRAWGAPSQFDPVYRASLESSVWDVLKIYFMEWRTPLIFRIGASAFPAVVALVIVVLLFRIGRGRADRWTLPGAFLIFLSIPLSWYILMKGHSFIHTHMNFVLWYFGFVQICLYILWMQIRETYNHIKVLQRRTV